MSGLINLDVGSIVTGIGKLADDLFTSDEERLKVALQEKAMDMDLVKGQLEINKAEANNPSMFIGGWRSAMGWTGVFALAYKFFFYEFILWAWALLQAYGSIPNDMMPPPSVSVSELYPIILGMLGLGGFRSFEKLKKVDTKTIK